MAALTRPDTFNEKKTDKRGGRKPPLTILDGDKAGHATGKIVSLDRLARYSAHCRRKGMRVVHCHGVFDLLHIGHIRYFEQARRMGDVLIVTLTQDRYVDKGPHRPAFTEALRAEAIASLKCVDMVAVNQWPTAENTLRKLRPHFYVKGAEFKNLSGDLTGKIVGEEKVVREIGAQIAFTEDIVFSSTNLINRHLSGLPEEVNKYLELFRRRYSLDQILEILDRMAKLKVLVIGDTIIDEYQFCEAIGKSSKDPTLVLKYQSHELFAGGILAVANHVANFAGDVQMVSVLGDRNNHEAFIRSQLGKNITPRFYVQDQAPTIVKRRYIDSYSFNKLMEIYDMDDSGLAAAEDAKLQRWLKKHTQDYDLVLAADFRHGAISDRTVRTLTQHAPYLAVNTQANAGNRGLHTISRYPRMDYGTIALHEFCLETRTRGGNIRPKMKALIKKLSARKMAVTLGRQGCAVSDRRGAFVTVPSFTQNVVDRVGAGDAFLSITSLAAHLNIDNELIGFIGNVVGSLAVGVVGNKKAIDKASVQKYVTSLMK